MFDFKNANQRDFLRKGNAKVYGRDNDKLPGEDMTHGDTKETMSEPQEGGEMDYEQVGQGLGKIFGDYDTKNIAKNLGQIDTRTQDVMAARRNALMNILKGR